MEALQLFLYQYSFKDISTLFETSETGSKTKTMLNFFLCICASLIPFIYGNGDSPHLEPLNMVKQMAAQNRKINHILQPLPNGFLGEGKFSFTYRGKLRRKEIAMKFTNSLKKSVVAREYQMYTYLHAINNETVEAYGIPAVYYFGPCFEGAYMVMGMTLLDSTFQEQIKTGFTDLDILMIFREFVRIAKYIHSCGCLHNDIKLANIMFRKNQAFIIDFNLASKTYGQSKSGTLNYMSRRSHITDERYPVDDFESFLYAMCRPARIDLGWINNQTLNNLPKDERPAVIYRMKLNTEETLNKIAAMESDVLKGIYRKFALQVLDDSITIPRYDGIYRIINEKIQSQISPGSVAVASWLSAVERQNAINFLTQNPPPKMSDIADPHRIRKGNPRAYPEVETNFFLELYH